MLKFFENFSKLLLNISGFFLRIVSNVDIVLERATFLLCGKDGLSRLKDKGSSIIRSGLCCTWGTTRCINVSSSCEYPVSSSSFVPIKSCSCFSNCVLGVLV